MQTQTIKEKTEGMKGTVKVRRYVAGTLNVARPYYRQANILEKLASISSGALGDFMLSRAQALKAKAQSVLDAGFIELAVVQRNLIVSDVGGTGKNLLARALGGDNTYSPNITYGEIGTGNTAPASSDVALTTPTDRVAVTSADISNNTVILRFFFSDGTLADGTYYEFGTFGGGGSATIGTGKMFNHALFGSPYVKGTGQDTTVDVEIDIN